MALDATVQLEDVYVEPHQEMVSHFRPAGSEYNTVQSVNAYRQIDDAPIIPACSSLEPGIYAFALVGEFDVAGWPLQGVENAFL